MPEYPTLSFDPVAARDAAAEAAVRSALADNPRGMSFGRLARIGAWVAGCQGEAPPRALENVRVVVFAGDHGIAERGVSAFTPDASVLQAAEISSGAAPVNVLARAAGASVALVDVSLNHAGATVRAGSGAIDIQDAMSADEFARAAELGSAAADDAVDSGVDLVVAGDLGVGNTSVAAAVLGTLTFTEPVVAVGRGSGINDEVWKTKVEVVRDAMFRVRPYRDDVPRVLQAISSPDFVALTAFIAQCAVRRTPVLIDGAFTAVAAYTAERVAPGTRHWLIPAQLSSEPSHVISVEALDLTPVVALDMTTGQGAGGAAVIPLIAAAVTLVRDEMRVQGLNKESPNAQ